MRDKVERLKQMEIRSAMKAPQSTNEEAENSRPVSGNFRSGAALSSYLMTPQKTPIANGLNNSYANRMSTDL